jgi:hypothetical protein
VPVDERVGILLIQGYSWFTSSSHPILLPAEPFCLHRTNAAYSPVEQAIRMALHGNLAGAARTYPEW